MPQYITIATPHHTHDSRLMFTSLNGLVKHQSSLEAKISSVKAKTEVLARPKTQVSKLYCFLRGGVNEWKHSLRAAGLLASNYLGCRKRMHVP